NQPLYLPLRMCRLPHFACLLHVVRAPRAALLSAAQFGILMFTMLAGSLASAQSVSFQAGLSATVSEVTGSHSVVIELTTLFALPSSVQVDVIDAGGGLALSGTDYGVVGTITVSFPAGATSGATSIANIGIIQDALVEGGETIDLQLSNVTGPSVLGNTTNHGVTITDNETATVEWRSPADNILESGGTNTAYIDLVIVGSGSPVLSADVTIDMSDLLTGSASSATDYTAVSSTTFTFSAGTGSGQSRSVSVPVLDDAFVEGNETVLLDLANISGPATLGDSLYTLTIIDDEPVGSASFQSGGSSIAENGGMLTVVVELSLTAANGNPIIVEISDLLTGSATAGTDYTLAGPVFLTFPAGSANGDTQSFTIPMIQDLLLEGNELVNLAITSITGPATSGATSAHAVTITDDEATGSVQFVAASSATANEASSTHNIVVTLTIPGGGVSLGQPVFVDAVDLLTGSASSGGDYSALASPTAITFPVGSVTGATSVVPISVIQDPNVEANETIDLQLITVTGPSAFGAITNHAATITDDDTATIAFQGASINTGSEATAPHFVTVELSIAGGGSLQAGQITIDVTDLLTGSASSAIDYLGFATTTLTFLDGSPDGSTSIITLTTLQDLLVEGNETANLDLTNIVGTNASIGAQSTHQLIIDDDETASLEFLAGTSATTNEATANHAIPILLNITGGATLGTQITVDVPDLLSGSASSASDYSIFPVTTVTFAAGAANGATQIINVAVIDDAAVEGNETVALRITSISSPGVAGAVTNHTATITDDDFPAPSVQFQSGSSAAAEAGGTNFVVLEITSLGGPSASDIVVDITDLLSGSADSATDYTALAAPIQITFPAGSVTSDTLVVGIGYIDDGLTEGNETIDLRITNVTNGTAGSTTNHEATIADDDGAFFSFQSTSSSVTEANVTHQVVVTLTIPGGGGLPVDGFIDVVDLLSGTANSATDYTAIPVTTLTFPAGSTDGTTFVLNITTLNDLFTEGNETIALDLSNVSGGGGVALGVPTTHSVTIVDDDSAAVQFANSASSAAENGGAHSIILTLDVTAGTTGADIIVDVTDLLTGSAGSSTDYTALATPVQVTFPAGSANGDTQVMNVVMTNDAVTEGDETIDLRISAVSGPGTASGTTNHSVTITDDENQAIVEFQFLTTSVGEATTTHFIGVILTFPGGIGTLGTPVTVDIVDLFTGSGSSGTDFSALSVPEVLTWPAGTVSGTARFLPAGILDDLIFEGDETIDLLMQNLTGPAVFGINTAHEVTILENDVNATVQFQNGTSSIAETAGTHTIVVGLTSTAALPSNMTVDITDLLTGSATSGTDYTALGALITLTFPAGSVTGATQTFNITILDDLISEGNETIDLRLSNPTSGLLLSATTNHVVTITDNEVAGVYFDVGTSAIGEDTVTHFVGIRLTVPGGGTIGSAVTVDISDLLSGSAGSSTDFTAMATPELITFPAGSPDGDILFVGIDILEDLIFEGDETIDLRMSNVTGPAALGTTTNHEVTITDDETGVTVQFANSASSILETGGSQQVVIQLTSLIGALPSDITVDITDLLTGSATTGTDYTTISPNPTTITFATGSLNGATQVITLPIIDDVLIEGSETINLQLSNPTGIAGLGNTSNHVVTITDDEAGGTVTFQVDSSSAAEGGGTHSVVVVLSLPAGSTANPITADITDLLTGSATSGSDYGTLATPVVLTFPAGSSNGATQVVPIGIIDDASFEFPEQINLRLDNITGPAGIGATTNHAVVILDDDNIPVVQFQGPTSTSPESGTHQVVVVMTLPSGTLPSDVTVEVTDLLTGSATSATDYTALAVPVVISFPIGSPSGTTQVVSIPITADLDIEPDETIDLRLANPSGGGGAVLGAISNHEVTISNDDTINVAFAAASSIVGEANTTHNVVVQLSGFSGITPSVFTVDVTDLLTGSASSSGTDYNSFGTITLTFPAGSAAGAFQVLPITILDDFIIEGVETIDLQLSNPSAIGQLGAITDHTVSINDDDAPFVAFQSATSSLAEANATVEVVITLTSPLGPLGADLTIDVQDLLTGTATSATDYSAFATTSLTFAAGATTGTTQVVVITILDDAISESSETINLDLTNLGGIAGAFIGAPSTHVITITDNDTLSIAKTVVSTDQAHTSGSNVVIGETISYQAVITLSEGSSPSFIATDTFPSDIDFVPGTLVVSLGNGGMTTGFVSEALSSTYVDPTLTITFSPVSNPGNGDTTDDTITITFDGIVANSATNNAGSAKTNAFSSTAGALNDSGTVAVSIVEPDISVAKTADNVSRCNTPASAPEPGDTLEYTVTVTETQGVDTFDLIITDVLSEGMAYDVSFAPTVSGAGNTIAAANVSGTGLPGDPQTLTWSLALGNADIDITANGNIVVVYRVTVLATVVNGQVLDNTATVGFTSLDGIVGGERSPAFAPGTNDYEESDTYSLSSAPAGTTFSIPASRRRNPTFIDANGAITGPGSPGTLDADDELSLTDGAGVTFTGDGISGPPPIGSPDITVVAGATATVNTDGTNSFSYGTVTINAGSTLSITGDTIFTMEQIVMGAGSTLTLPDNSNITVTGPCEFNGGVGTANYALIQTSTSQPYNITFNCSVLGDHFRFEDLGDGKLTFNGDTQLDFGIFVGGTGGTPYICYCDDGDVTWTNLAFDYGDGTATTIETCPGSGTVKIDGYASTIADIWVGGDPTDVEGGGVVSWCNPTPVRRLTGKLTPLAEGGIRVDFATEVEDGVASFELLRRVPNAGRWHAVTSLLATAPELGSAEYIYSDPVKAGQAYEYQVKVIDVAGTYRFHRLGESRAIADGIAETPVVSGFRSALPEINGVVSTPDYSVASHAVDTPVQTGLASKASVASTGLYHAAEGRLYNLGRQLPRLAGDLVFVRALSDYYTDTNVVWAGDLAISSAAGRPVDPLPDGFFDASGYTGRFRTEVNSSFSLNPHQLPGPNWYHPESLNAGSTVNTAIDLRSPQAGTATLTVAIRGNTAADHDLSVLVGGTALGRAVWTGEGHRHVSFRFDASILRDGANAISLVTTTANSAKRLDYVEIQAPAIPWPDGNGLLVKARAAGDVKVTFANFAVDATHFGGERLLPITPGSGHLSGVREGQFIYFSNTAHHLDWKPPVQLIAPDLRQVDYVAVAPAAFLDILDPLLERHENRGLSTAALSYEQVIDVYGAGIFGPAGIISLHRVTPARYVLLAAGTTYDYKRYEGKDTPLGIPTGWTQVDHGMAATDDIYTRSHAAAVGRLPARSRTELKIMVEKILAYQPSRRAVLLSDRDDSDSNGYVDRFATMQASLADTLPTALISATNRHPDGVRNELIAAIQAGSRIVAYQGHAGFNEIGDRYVHTEELSSFPTSAWLLSTCLTGSYFLNDNTPTLARGLLAEPDAGGALVIASTRFGHADDEHAIVTHVLNALAAGETNWGDIMRSLKQTLPGETIGVFQLFGDPAMQATDHTDHRDIALRSPQGATLIGGQGPIDIDFDLLGEGWLNETLRISYQRMDDGPLWTQIQEFIVPRSKTSFSILWAPPADGYYRLRIEAITD
ncbi:MAG: fimbrial isopeptide formation D2 family protein, partial [Rhodothermales bacterium]